MMVNYPSVTPTSHSKTCSECRRPLPTPSATTCSAKCRKRRERRQKSQHSAWIVSLRGLSEIRDALKRGEDMDHHRACLNRLKDEINDLLLLARDQDALQRREMFEARARRR